MQANIENFLTGVLDNRRLFYIPVYQRNYSWKEEHCKVLFEDILKLYNNQYNEHFIGSIVWKPDASNSDRLGVIDGQQRLTTMFLLTQAMYDLCDDDKLKNRLKDIVVDSYKEENRLEPIKKDNETFCMVIKNNFNEIKDKGSNIWLNYSYFKNRLEEEKVDLNKFFDAFNKLRVIKMELDYRDNPQVIFESINSTGMTLSIADLIRNFLLMNEEEKVQKELFENYWFKFEEKLGVDNLVLFFEHYLNIKVSENVTRKDMYKFFKTYYNKINLTTEEFLKELEINVNNYELLVTNKEIEIEDKKLKNKLNEIKAELIILNNKVVNMFLLNVLNDYEKGDINDEELVYSFEMTLSYVFRRSVVGLATNAMQRVFKNLYRQVLEYRKNNTYKDSLDYAFITSKENTNSRFPNDEEFFTSLSSRNLYGKFNNMLYLLTKLENYKNKTKIKSDNLTIEHIMPQTLDKRWKEQLGENYKLLHEENVNDLGNLTLTSYNSNMSNDIFENKKEILLEESHLKLNEYLKEKDSWGIKEIEKRGKILAKQGLDIWVFPNINEEVCKKIEENKYSKISIVELLENYQSLRFKSIEIEENIYQAKSYRDILEKIILVVYKKNKNKFEDIYVNNINYKRKINGNDYFMFSKENVGIGSYRYIEEADIYIDVGKDGTSLLTLAIDILDNFNIDKESVILEYYNN